jgi:ERF superfamily
MATDVEPIQEIGSPLHYVTLGDGIIASDWVLKNLNKALGTAQDTFTAAVKDLINSYGGYKYVPLENIIASSRPSLSKNHLTVMQFPFADLERKTITLTTRMVHWDSGEWVQSVLELPAELALGKDGALKFNQQTIGGGVTYARKIAYKPIVGVSDSDDDIDSTETQPSMDARPKKTTPAQALKTAPQQPAQPQSQPAPQQTQQQATPPQEQGIFKPMPGDLLTCVILATQEKKTAGEKGKPYMSATFNGRLHGFNFATAWDTGLFDALKAGVNKECQLQLKPFKESDKFINIIDVLFVDGQEYVGGKPLAEAEIEPPTEGEK